MSSTADMKSPQGKSSTYPKKTNIKLLIKWTFFFFSNCDGLVSLSCRIVCETMWSGGERSGQASVKVRGGGLGLSAQIFSFQVNTAALSMFTCMKINQTALPPTLFPSQSLSSQCEWSVVRSGVVWGTYPHTTPLQNTQTIPLRARKPTEYLHKVVLHPFTKLLLGF